MYRCRKNAGWLVALLILVLSVLPFGYSEAHQSELGISASVCDKVSTLAAEHMDEEEMFAARECDSVEASHDWEQLYGGLNEGEFAEGVVYE